MEVYSPSPSPSYAQPRSGRWFNYAELQVFSFWVSPNPDPWNRFNPTLEAISSSSSSLVSAFPLLFLNLLNPPTDPVWVGSSRLPKMFWSGNKISKNRGSGELSPSHHTPKKSKILILNCQGESRLGSGVSLAEEEIFFFLLKCICARRKGKVGTGVWFRGVQKEESNAGPLAGTCDVVARGSWLFPIHS